MPREQHKEPTALGVCSTSPSVESSSQAKRLAGDATFSTLDRLRVFQTVNRVWRPHLSGAERDLLFYLLDRTVSWGTNCVRTTIGQMVEGSSWVPTSGMSRATVFRAIKSLRERGVLSTAFDGRQSVFTLDVNWEPDAMSLPTPKRLKKQDARSTLAALFPLPETDELALLLEEENGAGGVSNRDSGSLKLRHQQSQFETLYNSTPTTVQNNSTPNPLPGVAGGGDQASSGYRVRTHATAPPTAQSAEQAAVKAKRKALTSRPMWVVWSDAWSAAFPNVPCTAWSRADYGMVRRVTDRAKQTGVDPSAFIEFCVAHWSEIIAREFAWMTQSPPPAYPQVRFLGTTKFTDKFLDRFAATRTQKRLSTDLGRDAEIERLMLTGLSFEDALIEYGKRKGVAEQRQELDKRGREIAVQAKALARNRPAPPQPIAKPQPRLIHPTENFYETGVELPDFSEMKWE